MEDEHGSQGQRLGLEQRPAGLAELAVALGYSYLSVEESVAELRRAGGTEEVEAALRGLTSLEPRDPSGVAAARRLLTAAFPARFEHVVAFYEDERFLARSVGRFLHAGLQRGEAVLVVATAAHHDAFAAELATAGHDVAGLARLGRYVTFDAHATLATLVHEGAFDAARFDREVAGWVEGMHARGQRVRVFGEMVALLWERGDLGLALEFEDRWNQVGGRTPFPLLCGYPMRGFESHEGTALFHAVCERHTGVTTESYAQLAADDDTDDEVVVLDRLVPGGRPRASAIG